MLFVVARSLSKSNIPAIVFEASAKGRSPGYGLTLKPQAYRPLLALLGLEEDSFRRSVAVDAELGGKGVVHSHLSFDARTGNIVNGATGHDSEEQEQDTNGGLLLRANKRRLRNLLAEGIDVRWEHEFKHVDTETTKESTLLARFENGQVVEGSLLVAADGVHSKGVFSENYIHTVLPLTVLSSNIGFSNSPPTSPTPYQAAYSKLCRHKWSASRV